jgi:hypothetical protein
MVCITGRRGLEWNGAPGSEAKPCGLESSPEGALYVRPASLAPVGRTSMQSIRLRHALDCDIHNAIACEMVTHLSLKGAFTGGFPQPFHVAQRR